ncbi:MAG TPA: PH domain-containing protein, partial [Actinomycetes bacterium]|nr:PH domain-containing protein [Actinomycetes bacterium]
ASLVLQPITVFLVLLIPTVVAFAGVAGVWELGLTGVFLIFAPITVVGGQFLKYFGFTVAQSSDGLRLRFGLTSHRSQTVPPGRVQAVRIERPLMWKPWGWVRVVVNVAGTAGGSESEERPSVVLPVAPLPVARAVLQRVLPGVDPFALPLTPAAPSARWRAPLQHRQLGAGATSSVFVARRGWLVPQWDVVPHARTQSVRVTQGPWQRWLGVASVHVDSTPGPVSIIALHQEAGAARAMADAQARRARLARSLGGPGQPENQPIEPAEVPPPAESPPTPYVGPL